jgi:hypothetical protein
MFFLRVTDQVKFFLFWALAASMKLSVSFRLLDLGQSTGFLVRVISSSQGLCVSAPGDCEDGEVGRMKWFWQGKSKYSEKSCPDATSSTTNSTCQTRARTRVAAVGSQRLTASAMARPDQVNTHIKQKVRLIPVRYITNKRINT